MAEVNSLTEEVGDELTVNLFGSNGQNDCLQSVDCVHLEVDFLSLHLFLDQGKGVHGFDHRYFELIGCLVLDYLN